MGKSLSAVRTSRSGRIGSYVATKGTLRAALNQPGATHTIRWRRCCLRK